MLTVKDDVISFVAEKLKIEISRVHETSFFMADLGLSSLRSLELICDVEDQFDIRIPDQAISGLLQVKDLIAFIDQTRGSNYVEPRTSMCARSV